MPGDYFVSVMTDCYLSEGSILVSTADDCNPNIYIPNVFSPNGDGINDVWEVQIDPALQVSGISCSIFDRWGDLIFETKSQPVAWDGVFNGKAVAPGVYVYVVGIEKENRETQVLSGDITLVR